MNPFISKYIYCNSSYKASIYNFKPIKTLLSLKSPTSRELYFWFINVSNLSIQLCKSNMTMKILEEKKKRRWKTKGAHNKISSNIFDAFPTNTTQVSRSIPLLMSSWKLWIRLSTYYYFYILKSNNRISAGIYPKYTDMSEDLF